MTIALLNPPHFSVESICFDSTATWSNRPKWQLFIGQCTEAYPLRIFPAEDETGLAMFCTVNGKLVSCKAYAASERPSQHHSCLRWPAEEFRSNGQVSA